MLTFISSIPRVLNSGLAGVGAFFRQLGHAIIEVEEDRAKLEAEVFHRYNRINSQTEINHAVSH